MKKTGNSLFIQEKSHLLAPKKRQARYLSRAQIHIINIFDGKNAILKNCSITGCCIECEDHISIKPYEVYIIDVFPEDTTKFERFELLAESRWVQFKDKHSEIGFSLISSPYLFSQYRNWCRNRSQDR